MNRKLKILLFMGLMGLFSCKKGCFIDGCCDNTPYYPNGNLGDVEFYINKGDRFEWKNNKGEIAIATCIKKQIDETTFKCQVPKQKCNGETCKKVFLTLWFDYGTADITDKITELYFNPASPGSNSSFNHGKYKITRDSISNKLFFNDSLEFIRNKIRTYDPINTGMFGTQKVILIYPNKDTLTWTISKIK